MLRNKDQLLSFSRLCLRSAWGFRLTQVWFIPGALVWRRRSEMSSAFTNQSNSWAMNRTSVTQLYISLDRYNNKRWPWFHAPVCEDNSLGEKNNNLRLIWLLYWHYPSRVVSNATDATAQKYSLRVTGLWSKSGSQAIGSLRKAVASHPYALRAKVSQKRLPVPPPPPPRFTQTHFYSTCTCEVLQIEPQQQKWL